MSLIGFGDDRGIIKYQAVVTREFPLWNLTVTGGDLPESGHVMASMSYARLVGDMNDWLHCHQFGTPSSTYGWSDPDDDRYDEDFQEEDDDDGHQEAEVGAAGFGVTFDHRWPQAAKDALDRYWAAKKAMNEAREAMIEPISTLAHELQAEEQDVAQLIFMPTRKVRQIILRHNRREIERLAREERDGNE